MKFTVTYRDGSGVEHSTTVTAPGPGSARAHVELTKTSHRESVQIVTVKVAA